MLNYNLVRPKTQQSWIIRGLIKTSGPKMWVSMVYKVDSYGPYPSNKIRAVHWQ